MKGKKETPMPNTGLKEEMRAFKDEMHKDTKAFREEMRKDTVIMEVMREYGYVDFRGMGLRTKVVPLMRSHNGCDPIFEATEDYLKVTLPKRSDSQ